MTTKACPWRRDDTPSDGHTWVRLGAIPDLVLLVGVTGVGKTTALAALDTTTKRYSLLPDRRVLTDEVIIGARSAVGPLTREERFELTARYRETHPGGMAEVLGRILVIPDGATVVFDGLRGAQEVEYALEYFPKARFLVLEAPDTLRVRRLLGRNDAFDRGKARDSGSLEGDLGSLEGAAEVFGEEGLQELAGLPSQGFRAADVLDKAGIVLAERRSYDPAAARRVLEKRAARRTLFLDTAALNERQVSARVAEWA
ncbi:MAG TPA: AAA family ATPase [Deinococcales bacterium]|nr:AAA family ATPase [Deinococcales bacterium]